MYFVVAANKCDYDHISVTLPNKERCPKWNEMCAIKDLFFHREETVIQYHPAEKDYIDIHQYCLHLWRPQKETIPVSPTWMV